jgi:hypothetical protein
MGTIVRLKPHGALRREATSLRTPPLHGPGWPPPTSRGLPVCEAPRTATGWGVAYRASVTATGSSGQRLSASQSALSSLGAMVSRQQIVWAIQSVIEIHHDEANPANGAIARRLGFTEVDRVRVPDGPQAPGETGVQVRWRLLIQDETNQRVHGFPEPS